MRIEVPLAGRTLYAQVWLAQVGRVPLLLLDSDVEQNCGYEREMTDRLYGGGTDHRLAQEVLLGIGGVRAIRAYCAITGTPAPEVFHTNEGHAGFLGLERIREYMVQGMNFDAALERNRAGTVFTTHTPVPAGIDRFPRELIVDQFAALRRPAAGPGAGPRRRGLRGRRPEQVQHGGDGLPARPAGQRRVACCTARCPGRCSRDCGRPSTPPRCRSPRSPTACITSPGCTTTCSSCWRRRPGAARRRSSTATTGTRWPRSTATPSGR